MEYKVGDRVRIVSETTEGMNWIGEMDVYLGKVMTIKNIISGLIFGGRYKMAEDDGEYYWDDSMIAGLASETPFDFNAWKDKDVCMHCKTEEEAEDFCKVMDMEGLRWNNDTSYLGTSRFDFFKETTCYCFNKGTYTGIGQAKNNGYTILEWSEYRSTEPPKDEEQEEQEKTMETKIDDKPLDFKEAMGIYKRLCEHHHKRSSCKECPVSSFKNYPKKLCRDFLIENTDKAEPILKQWAAEHPVKTNEQKCNEMFLEVFGVQYATALMDPNWWKQKYVEPHEEKE